MSFFAGITDQAAMRLEYHRLIRLHHPDKGGDAETMKRVNAEYGEASKRLLRAEVDAGDRTEGSYAHNVDLNEKLRAKLEELLLIPGIDIEISGLWFWISGDTKPVKERLKAAGCRWAAKKKLWYYAGVKTSSWGKKSMREVRAAYGSTKVKRGSAERLEESR